MHAAVAAAQAWMTQQRVMCDHYRVIGFAIFAQQFLLFPELQLVSARRKFGGGFGLQVKRRGDTWRWTQATEKNE